ncbi:alpha/beta fold hydrolase [Agromyces sp. CFH 90414]|uniref:Alpha/beta fold hydrolase n=1 Tax=Agromyces agglutinans TaxID=2662258 RepID=A0A6I2F3Z3_9MICO|nr:alpha/beta hydrolase [Agromyces agglutinans]MRG59299.1 alpha/beta fold hydrolase [Agromyces agglutinans]
MGFTRRGTVVTPVLEIAYEEAGDPAGEVVVLSHGFPYDVRAYDEVAGLLAASGLRVIAPYLRGSGPTRFTDASTMRSGEQAALAQDLVDLLDGLGVERAILGGYDWGGRASCIVAALFPDRVKGLVTVGGYNVFGAGFGEEPMRPEWERTYWYQYYFHSERGRRGLERFRRELCELLWTTWSPEWAGAAEAFAASAPSLDNPDFVDVVVHSYRHRFGLVEGDPRYAAIEAAVAAEPPIVVPTVVLESGADGVGGPSAALDRAKFTGTYTFRELAGIGHDLPQEAPAEFAEAVRSLLR